jgi:hypothetical protein
MTNFKIERPVSTVTPVGRKFTFDVSAGTWMMKYTYTNMLSTQEEAQAAAVSFDTTMDKLLTAIENTEIPKQNIMGGLVQQGKFISSPKILDQFDL